MAMLNQAQLQGYVKFKERKSIGQNGTTLISFNLGVPTGIGEYKHTVYIPCELWGKMADGLDNYIHDGDVVIVSGSLNMDKWQDKDSGKNRTKLKLKVDRFHFPGNAKSNDGGSERQASKPAKDADEFEDDVPF